MDNVAQEYCKAIKKVASLKEELHKWKCMRDYSWDCLKHRVTHKGQSDWGDSGINWWLFPSDMSDEEINSELVKMDIIEDTDRGVWDDNDWDCSGQTLVYHPSIKRTKTRVLVTQSWAIDC